MCDAWKEGLEAEHPQGLGRGQEGFATLCGWMEPIGKGNELTLTYVPGKAPRSQVNGKAKGVLPGKPTSDAILATWIGPDPAPGRRLQEGRAGRLARSEIERRQSGPKKRGALRGAPFGGMRGGLASPQMEV